MNVGFQFRLKRTTNKNADQVHAKDLTRRMKPSLNFWKISMKSFPGGGLARMVNMPSESTKKCKRKSSQNAERRTITSITLLFLFAVSAAASAFEFFERFRCLLQTADKPLDIIKAMIQQLLQTSKHQNPICREQDYPPHPDRYAHSLENPVCSVSERQAPNQEGKGSWVQQL